MLSPAVKHLKGAATPTTMARVVQPAAWLIYFEMLEQMRERVHSLRCDISCSLSEARLRPWWRKEPLLAGHVSKRLEWLKGALQLLNIKLRDIAAETTPEDAETELELASYIAKLEADLTLYEVHYAALADILAQRMANHDGPDWDKLAQHTHDFSDLDILFRAADAVVLGFFIDVFGVKWVTDQVADGRSEPLKWFPLALFSSREGYKISPATLIATLPQHDLYRTRMWPSLAHEIGHAKVLALFGLHSGWRGYLWFRGSESLHQEQTWSPERAAALARLFPNPADRTPAALESILKLYTHRVGEIHEIHHCLGVASPPPGDANYAPSAVVLGHHHELLADAIAVHVGGPAALLSLLAQIGWDAWIVRSGDPDSLARWAAGGTHPPAWVRIRFMLDLLTSRRAIDQSLVDLAIAPYTKHLLQHHNAQERAALEAWERRMSSLVHGYAALTEKIVACAPFDASWLRVAEGMFASFSDDVAYEWSPRLTLNVGWIKRVRVHSEVRMAADRGLPRDRAMRSAGGPAPGMFPVLSRRLASWAQETLDQLTAADE